jgi:predicted ATP-grasp superfamily ATP-dependent carboligase
MPSAVDRSSGYVLEWDLRTIDLSKTDILSPRFSVNGMRWRINIHKTIKNNKLGVYLNAFPQYPSSESFPGTIRFRFDLVKRADNQIVKSGEWTSSIYNYSCWRGFSNWVDPGTIRDHILKVEMWIDECFRDFVEKPSTFYDHRSILFDKENSDFSFKVGDKVVYVVRGILTSRSDYFRAMLLGNCKEARVPVTVDAQIPIHGISSNVFEMIVEWLYTMDVRQLNLLSPFSSHTLEYLERVYVAADMLLITDLCDSIVKFLMHLMSNQNFGEIYQIAMRIENTTLEKTVFQLWITNSESFNKNTKQIHFFLHEHQEEHAILNKKKDMRESMGSAVKSSLILGISRKIIQTSSWTGDKESSLSVIKSLTSSLSLAVGVNMDKGIPIYLI